MAENNPMTDTRRLQTSLSDNLRDLFVKQLQHELKNYTLYNSFSVYYGCKGLEKLSKYYKARADEELVHQEWIMNYLTECDAVFEYPSVPLNENQKVNDDVTPFRLTVEREVETSGMIRHLADTALAEGDWMTLSFLLGTFNQARLIPEQIEEESLSRTALDIMTTEDHILKKENQIYDLYFSNKEK